MDDEIRLLEETARRAFSACGEHDLAESHRRILDSGALTVMLGPEAGGFGGGWHHAFPILFAAGESALFYPVAESILAATLLSQAGLAAPKGILSLALNLDGNAYFSENHLVFSGRLSNVAFGENAEAVAAIIAMHDEIFAACFRRDQAIKMEQRSDIAGEPRNDVLFDNARVAAGKSDISEQGILRAMALARACQMAGAIAAALSLSVTHTRQREQFGRPLASFQAIQQQLAVFAEEAAAARAAAQAACLAADRSDAAFETAASKFRVNRAAAVAASIAHQVHGAIGFTRDYALQKFTRRLWAWRSEYGNERKWAAELGARAARAGADGFWPSLVSGFAS